MSILDTKIIKNPAKFYEWAGSIGEFKTYNSETKENEYVKDITFIVVDQAMTLKGWDDSTDSAIWSNELKDIKKPFIVKNSKGVIEKGLYSELKSDVKFCKVLYGYDINNNDIIGVKLYGSSLGVALNNKIFDGDKYTLSVNPEIQKKGANKYYIPTIEKIEATPEEIERAKELYKTVLLPYLDEYYANSGEDTSLNEDFTGVDIEEIDLEGVPPMPF